MRLFLIYLIVVLTPVSLAAGLKRQGRFFNVVHILDALLLSYGLITLALLDVLTTNPLAKYEEGFPNVDPGGVSPDIILVNLLTFALPLLALLLGESLRGRFSRLPQTE